MLKKIIIFCTDFVDGALKKIEDLEKATKESKKATVHLAQYFCEDPAKFQPQECFTLLADFLQKVKKAHKVNTSFLLIHFSSRSEHSFNQRVELLYHIEHRVNF